MENRIENVCDQLIKFSLLFYKTLQKTSESKQFEKMIVQLSTIIFDSHFSKSK